MSLASRKAAHGRGRAVLRLFGEETCFSELSYTYPLKLLSPAATFKSVSLAYILTYGGGLVGGDEVHLTVDVGPDSKLVLLTQGSTKVFRARNEARLSNIAPPKTTTSQRMDGVIAPGALLVLLPDPVTPFCLASYSQTQIFHLQANATLLLLDWFTSGRMSRGETWEFSRYQSINEIWSQDQRIVRDVLLLEDEKDPTGENGLSPPRAFKDRLGLYDCYATVFLYGPLVQTLILSLKASFDSIRIMQQNTPDRLIWSLSLLDGGCVVRVASKETAELRNWLKDSLSPLSEVIGKDAFGHAFPT